MVKKFKLRKVLFCLALIFLIILSFITKIKIDEREKAKQNALYKAYHDKTIVTVWMKDSPSSLTRQYQVNKYNKENKDHIYIDFRPYKDEYANLLKTSVTNKDQPDIFQYGYSELIKNQNLMSMNELGIDEQEVGKGNLLYLGDQPIGVRLIGNAVKFTWNKEMFKNAGLSPDSPPKTWDELIQDALKIKEKYPDVTPFEFPAQTFASFKASVGEPSVNQGNIYASFWDYKQGKYNFDSARNILSVYQKLYSLGLINQDFEKMDKDSLRKDFYEKKTAMLISTFEDKNYFTGTIPLSFPVGVSNLPKMSISDTDNYYYIDGFNFLVVNKAVKNKEAVKKVLYWLLSEDVNREIMLTNKALPTVLQNKPMLSEDIYKGYNDVSNFKNELFDPTVFIGYNEAKTLQLSWDAVKGKISVDEAIKQLNQLFLQTSEVVSKAQSIDLSKFTEK